MEAGRMSRIEVRACDNPKCKHTARPDEAEGWLTVLDQGRLLDACSVKCVQAIQKPAAASKRSSGSS
jgi:hypothetical protein